MLSYIDTLLKCDKINPFKLQLNKWCNCTVIPNTGVIEAICYDYELEAISDFEKKIGSYKHLDVKLIKVNQYWPYFMQNWHIQQHFKNNVIFVEPQPSR